jgi:hypothetical protein
MRPRSWICTLIMIAAQSPLLAERPQRTDITPRDRESVVIEAYARLSRRAPASGRETPTFSVSSFRHIDPSEFSRVKFVDVVSLPTGAVIDVVSADSPGEGRGAPRGYRVKWRLPDTDLGGLAEHEELDSVTLEAALARAKDTNGWTNDVVAITQYEVVASFEGRSRRYMAAVLWHETVAGAIPLFVFVDLVTDGIEKTLADREPARAVPADFSNEKLLVGPNAVTYCSDATVIERATGWAGKSGTDGHYSGSHVAKASVEWTCTCDSACTSRVSGRIYSSTCNDSGIKYQFPGGVFTVHKMAEDHNFPNNVAFNANVVGAESRGGYICAMQVCPYGICNLTVGVSISMSGPTFTVSYNSNPTFPSWKATQDFGIKCPACAELAGGEIPPIEHDSEWSGGGGLGGSGGGTGCSCREYGDVMVCYPAYGGEYCTVKPVCVAWQC